MSWIIRIFEGTPEHFRTVGALAADQGLPVSAVTVLPDAAHNAASTDPAARAGALTRMKWAIDCLQAANGTLLRGPF